MPKTLDDLADVLFSQIEELRNKDVTKEDIDKANTIVKLSSQVINTRKLQLQAVMVKREMGLQSPGLKQVLLPEGKE